MCPDAPNDVLLGKHGSHAVKWTPLVPRIKLGPDQQMFLGTSDGSVNKLGPISHVRLTIYPDGGISRLRLFGKRAPQTPSRSKL